MAHNCTRRLIPLSLLEHQLQIFGAFGWSATGRATITLTISVAAAAAAAADKFPMLSSRVGARVSVLYKIV